MSGSSQEVPRNQDDCFLHHDWGQVCLPYGRAITGDTSLWLVLCKRF